MTSANLGALVRRATLATAIALSLSSISAHAVVLVDGNLTDLIGEVASHPWNVASATDPLGSTEATESNNGFDIRNVYAYYQQPTNVLFLGMNFYGTVGDSRAITDTTSTTEYLNTSTCASTYCNRSVFDQNENYSIQLFDGTTTSHPMLLSFAVNGLNDGSDSLSVASNPFALSITRAVSEANNGVEFSIAGLDPLLIPYGFSNPANLLIRFGAGSGDPNPVSGAADDYHLLQMQVVPVPAAAWLFGSGLVGLMAAARKRQQTA